MRAGIAICLFFAGVGSAAAQWNAWQVGKTTELVSGQQRMVAQLRTTEVDQQSYQRHKGAILSIFCDGGKTGARIQFLGKVSYSSKVTVRYKTDRYEQKNFQTGTSSDRRSIYLDSGAQAEDFSRQVIASSKLLVDADAPGPGRSRALFHTTGAAEAIATALKDCRR